MADERDVSTDMFIKNSQKKLREANKKIQSLQNALDEAREQSSPVDMQQEIYVLEERIRALQELIEAKRLTTDRLLAETTQHNRDTKIWVYAALMLWGISTLAFCAYALRVIDLLKTIVH